MIFYKMYSQTLPITLLVIALLLSRIPADQSGARLDDFALPQQHKASSGVYSDKFDTYQAKDFTTNAEWDIWLEGLHLAQVDSSEQYRPNLAIDATGNAIVVWQDYLRTGHVELFAQKIDRNGNRLWSRDVQIGPTSFSGSKASIAINASNDAFIVWADGQNDNSNIYIQKLDPNGNKVWPATFQVNENSNLAYRGSPVLSITPDGDLLIVWVDQRNQNYDLYAQKLDNNGNWLWLTDLLVNADSQLENQSAPTIAVNDAGNAIVAWQEYVDSKWEIYANQITPGGQRGWATDFRLISNAGSVEQRSPVLAAHGNIFYAVWVEQRNTSNPHLFAQKFDPLGNKLWANDLQIDPVASAPTLPDIDTDPSGNLWVIWDDGNAGGVYTQKVSETGNLTWPDPVRVNIRQGSANQGVAAIGIAGDGSAMIAWGDQQDSYKDIYAQKLDSFGNRTWNSDTRIIWGIGSVKQENPALTIHPNGDIFYVWQDYRNDSSDIFAQKVNSLGDRLWMGGIRVNFDSEKAVQSAPRLAADSDGSIIVTWIGNRQSNLQVLLQKLDSNGNKLWNSGLPASSGQSGQYQPAVAIDLNHNIFVVWSEMRVSTYGRDIFIQKLSGTGQPLWGSGLRVNSDNGNGIQEYPDIAVDGQGNVLVAWHDQSAGNRIYVQKFNPDGNTLWGGAIEIAPLSFNAYPKPSLAIDNNRNAIIVWETDTFSGSDIYAQKLNENGIKLWGDGVPVIVEGSFEMQSYPEVGVDSSGNAIIAWLDARNKQANNYVSDIYAQKLDAAGHPVWASDLRVNSNTEAIMQWAPTIAIDQNDQAVFAWQDQRNNNQDIFTQRINRSGAKIWPSDLQLVFPDCFYFLSGVVQSRTIGTLPEDIRQATLIADTQTNGGDVRFSLSNDGGQHWLSALPGVTTRFTSIGSDLRWKAELIADPIWQRSPLITSIRIEYSSQTSDADDYEADDTCRIARPLAVNGASQSHTFHQFADADWARFEVITGQTYIIQTTESESRADTSLELYPDCPQSALISTNNDQFSSDARITWKATDSRPVWVKVSNANPENFGANTGYRLAVRTAVKVPVAIIIAGHNDANQLQTNIDHMADLAYLTLLNTGIPKSNLRYLAPKLNRDVDGNGLNDDISGLPTPTNVRDAIQNWSRQRGVALDVPFFIYMVDHGHYDQFLADGSSGVITAAELDLWLSNLESTTGTDEINVILESCKSGSFIDITDPGPAKISRHNRVVIASTSSSLNAYASAQGGYFSDTFWTALGQSMDLHTAFQRAKQAVQDTGLTQTPWLDDNGDGQADTQDGALASRRGLASAFTNSSLLVDWGTASISSGGLATLQAQVQGESEIDQVWAEIYRPDFVEPPPTAAGTTPELNRPIVLLPHANGNRFETQSSGFSQPGVYRLVFYAQDSHGKLALPVTYTLTVNRKVFLPIIKR